MNYKYILFDLDGTLTDPTEGILNSIRHALTKYEMAIPDDSVLRTFVGPPLKQSFMEQFHVDEATAEQLIVAYREYFSTKGLYENLVFAGIPELLAQLQTTHTLLLATSKPETFARQILEHFDLAKYFTFIGGATMDSTRSKKADVIRYALENVGITDVADKNQCVMVGDTAYDTLGAFEAGITSIGVLWGIDTQEQLLDNQATYLAATPEEILYIV